MLLVSNCLSCPAATHCNLTDGEKHKLQYLLQWQVKPQQLLQGRHLLSVVCCNVVEEPDHCQSSICYELKVHYFDI